MKEIRHDERLLILLSLVGLIALFGMGILNILIDNRTNGIVETVVGIVGVINLIWFGIRRKLVVATHIVLVIIWLLMIYLVIMGGFFGSGIIWILVYPSLAFALRDVKVASWYVSTLGVGIFLIATLRWTNYPISIYNGVELFQLLASYSVISLMLSLSERVHERINREYIQQGSELELEKTQIASQAAELRKFKVAVAQSSEMMIITDAEGIVLWANEATTKVTGFSVSETLGKKAGVLWGKLMDKSFYEEMWKVIKEEKRQFVGEIQNHRKNSEKFYSMITIYPLLDNNQQVEFFVATQRDITEEKEVDQMKTDFVSLTSHQLRTPLSSMRWNLEMLSQGDLGKLSAKQKEVVDSVAQSNMRMIKLISTLLNISRIESGRLVVDPEKIKLRSYLREMKKECVANYRGQSIKLELGEKEIEVKVDVALLRQVLTNLVSNASKYSQKDSQIIVRLDLDRESYSIHVIDNGYGIPISEQRKIFSKFFRASNVEKYETDGTGMGLYICTLIANLLGGEIGFVSQEGKGSDFWVKLPIKGVPALAGEVRLV